MEPVQPSTTGLPSPEAPPPQSGGVFSRLKQGVGTYFAVGSPDGSAAVAVQPSFAPSTTPGLEPRRDAPSTATIPSPWANPDVAAAVQPAPIEPSLGSIVVTSSSEPTITPAPEPAADQTAAPAPEPTPAPNLEPTTEATPAVSPSPVWTEEPAVATATVSDGVAPTDLAAAGEEAFKNAATSAETTEEPPLFRKVADGDLIRYEFTPEGRERIKGAFAKAIEEGTFDNILGPLMEGSESAKLDASTPKAADTQGAHETTPLTTTSIDTSPNSTVIPTTPTTQPDWSDPAVSSSVIGGNNPTTSTPPAPGEPDWSNPGQPITR